MKVRTRILIDLMFYLALPLLIWNTARESLGDYLAMFTSAGTGIAYTAFKFYYEKRYNLTGIIIVFGITLNLLLNVISDSAIEILRNGLILNGSLAALYLISLLIRRPLGHVFYIDYRRMYGEDQQLSAQRAIRFDKRRYFDYLTALFLLREMTLLIVKWRLISRLGIEGANVIILVNRSLSYAYIGLIALMTVAIDKQWKAMLAKEEEVGR